MNMVQELVDNQILLSVFSADFYNQSIFETMKDLENKKLCYVTLNKTSSSLMKAFASKKIPTQNVFFIDAVSQGIGEKSQSDNVLNVSSPAALTELSIAISESMSVFDIMVFDSLSTLKIYQLKDQATQKFTSHVMNKIRSQNRKGIFICLEEDLESSLIKNAFMYVDKHLNFTDFYAKLKRKKMTQTYGLLLVVAVFGVAMFSSLNIGSSEGATAMVIGAGQSGPSWILTVFLAFVAVFLILKGMALRPLPAKKLLNIKPAQTDPDSIRSQFRSKLQSWSKKLHIL